MSSTDFIPEDATARATFLHRDVLQLSALLLIAIAAFFVTRAVAANNRAMTLRDAAEWYRRGQVQMDRAQADEAIESLRRATARDRNEKRYVLALARALTLKGDYDAAGAQLLTLRDSAPEDPDINWQLARLAADRQDVTDALRFYRSALYAPWPPEQFATRRQIRLELIRFLLGHDQATRAQSELLALASDLPDDVAIRVEVARLFVTAGDEEHALEQFQRALTLAPESVDALAGAGQAAFRLGNYALARTYLQHTSADLTDASRMRELVELVLSMDPLVGRIGSIERRRRFLADWSYAQERMERCPEPAGTQTDETTLLLADVHALTEQLKSLRVLEQDTVEAGVDMMARIAQHVTTHCGPATPRDQALLLVGRRHGRDGR